MPLLELEHTDVLVFTDPATGTAVTVKLTVFEVKFPQVPETKHLYCLPFIPRVTALSVKEADVAPEISAKLPELLSCHL